VRNEACGVAFADVLIREGVYPGVRLPATPGYEVVGVADAVGPNVDEALIGASVAALTVTGGYARYVCVPEADCVPVPEALASTQAAALVLNGLTAYQMLTRVAPFGRLRTILIHGAAGGVGSVLLDLARWRGVTAYGSCSASKSAFVREKGGIAIDYRASDVVAEVLEHTRGDGVDAVFDGLGGATTTQSFKALASGGVCVIFGAQGALDAGRSNPLKLLSAFLQQPRFSALALMLSNRGVAGYMIEDWKRARPDFYREDLATIFRLAVEGHVRPLISQIYGLDEAADAHVAMNAARHQGKLVIDPWR
jgi:NADPH:quinone reductase-like Zn-dependent oxidoreductase